MEHKRFSPTEEQLGPKFIEEAEEELTEAFSKRRETTLALDEVEKYGWPFAAQDILQDRIEYEDRLRFVDRPTPQLSEREMRREIPSQVWSPAARYVFGFNITKFMSLMMP